MKLDDIRKRAFAMPLTSPAFPPGPYRFVDREYLIMLVGTLDYGQVRMATGTMGFKHKALDLKSVRAGMEKPNYLLKIIPHVDGTPRILELADGASGARAARAAAAWP